jgi:hypothetical protein
MGTYIWPFLFGAFGWLLTWLATNFFGKPYLDFRNLKSQVHQELIFTANVGQVSRDTPDYSNAVDSLRHLGTQVLAVVPPLRWGLNVCGYDLAKAGNGLIGLSNSLSEYDDGRTRHKAAVLTGLRLPRDLL